MKKLQSCLIAVAVMATLIMATTPTHAEDQDAKLPQGVVDVGFKTVTIIGDSGTTPQTPTAETATAFVRQLKQIEGVVSTASNDRHLVIIVDQTILNAGDKVTINQTTDCGINSGFQELVQAGSNEFAQTPAQKEALETVVHMAIEEITWQRHPALSRQELVAVITRPVENKFDVSLRAPSKPAANQVGLLR